MCLKIELIVYIWIFDLQNHQKIYENGFIFAHIARSAAGVLEIEIGDLVFHHTEHPPNCHKYLM